MLKLSLSLSLTKWYLMVKRCLEAFLNVFFFFLLAQRLGLRGNFKRKSQSQI